MKKLGVAMLMAVVGYAGMAQATIYEWVENGIDTYSDSPPSAESGMGGHFHGAYTEGGVEVSISKANPEILADNAASNVEYRARRGNYASGQNIAAFNQQIIHAIVPSGTPNMAALDPIIAADDKMRAQVKANEAKFGAESGPNGIVAGYPPQVISQAVMQK